MGNPSTGSTRPLAPSIHPACVYEVDDLDHYDRLLGGEAPGYTYLRDGHPNARALGEALAALEGGAWGVVCGSGMAALSLTFLAGYGGMLSLAQMTIAGIAGYGVAIFGVSGTPEISLGWPWPLVVIVAVAIAIVSGALIGWLSVRTAGIYTIMITLAIGVAFFPSHASTSFVEGVRDLPRTCRHSLRCRS